VEDARASLATLLGARPAEIGFTSGATEANNLALKGCTRALARRVQGRHLVTTALEHDSVIVAAHALEPDGFLVTVVEPDHEGIVPVERMHAALREDTLMVSMGAVNGELGTLQPFEEVGALCRRRGIVFHTDATQAVGKIPVPLDRIQVDLLSLSAHKLYGPKGVGALYVRENTPVEPLFHGGGQEWGLRSGTLNVPGIVGLGAAARLRLEEMESEAARLGALRDELWAGIHRLVPDALRNGNPQRCIPGTLNAAFPRVEAERLLLALKGFGLSAGSACHSGKGGPSPILAAIGLDPALASSCVRFGLGRSTTADEVNELLDALEKALRRLRGPVPTGTPAAMRYD
jgi:cysteine desulfurase